MYEKQMGTVCRGDFVEDFIHTKPEVLILNGEPTVIPDIYFFLSSHSSHPNANYKARNLWT